MRRVTWFTVVGAALLGIAAPAEAGYGDGCGPFARFCWDYEMNKYWPLPFVYADRETAKAPFAAMAMKGWQRQNTLGDYHFDTQNELTEAGRLKVGWILTQPTPARRTVMVPRAESAQATASRIAAVQNYLGSLYAQEGGNVMETGLRAPSFPADYVNDIDTSFRESTPVPRLPKAKGLGLDQ